MQNGIWEFSDPPHVYQDSRHPSHHRTNWFLGGWQNTPTLQILIAGSSPTSSVHYREVWRCQSFSPQHSFAVTNRGRIKLLSSRLVLIWRSAVLTATISYVHRSNHHKSSHSRTRCSSEQALLCETFLYLSTHINAFDSSKKENY